MYVQGTLTEHCVLILGLYYTGNFMTGIPFPRFL